MRWRLPVLPVITGIPFAAGCPRPLIREIETAPDIHGDSGLDGPVLPEPVLTLDSRHAVQLIIDTIMAHPPKTITLVPTAGLTNIALAARLEPRIIDRVKEVVLMGGGYHTGNWSAVAEFNIKIDPEAAHIVFNAGWPLTMVRLDLTHQALATPEVVSKIAAVAQHRHSLCSNCWNFSAPCTKAPRDLITRRYMTPARSRM
ncbi:Pyrimidine-specific ribonucleoside hydrolase rihB [Morganella morganii]|nr:Pyrimidine-specific ribonucleoside hydrolase rihB [Morganella morganii]